MLGTSSTSASAARCLASASTNARITCLCAIQPQQPKQAKQAQQGQQGRQPKSQGRQELAQDAATQVVGLQKHPKAADGLTMMAGRQRPSAGSGGEGRASGAAAKAKAPRVIDAAAAKAGEAAAAAGRGGDRPAAKRKDGERPQAHAGEGRDPAAAISPVGYVPPRKGEGPRPAGPVLQSGPPSRGPPIVSDADHQGTKARPGSAKKEPKPKPGGVAAPSPPPTVREAAGPKASGPPRSTPSVIDGRPVLSGKKRKQHVSESPLNAVPKSAKKGELGHVGGRLADLWAQR